MTTAGFPHSETLGSTFGCQLPEDYRRLQRPSSPPAAKASTVCAYSLDHIPKQSSRYTARKYRFTRCHVATTLAAPHTGYSLDSLQCVYHTHTTSITEASHFRNHLLSHFYLVKKRSRRIDQRGQATDHSMASHLSSMWPFALTGWWS